MAAFLTVPNSVILAQAVADEAGLALGDAITLNRSGQLIPAEIVGLLQPADDISRRALSGHYFHRHRLGARDFGHARPSQPH